MDGAIEKSAMRKAYMRLLKSECGATFARALTSASALRRVVS
jgi:hypothetical protein